MAIQKPDNALSSTEAEYMVMTQLSIEAILLTTSSKVYNVIISRHY